MGFRAIQKIFLPQMDFTIGGPIALFPAMDHQGLEPPSETDPVYTEDEGPGCLFKSKLDGVLPFQRGAAQPAEPEVLAPSQVSSQPNQNLPIDKFVSWVGSAVHASQLAATMASAPYEYEARGLLLEAVEKSGTQPEIFEGVAASLQIKGDAGTNLDPSELRAIGADLYVPPQLFWLLSYVPSIAMAIHLLLKMRGMTGGSTTQQRRIIQADLIAISAMAVNAYHWSLSWELRAAGGAETMVNNYFYGATSGAVLAFSLFLARCSMLINYEQKKYKETGQTHSSVVVGTVNLLATCLAKIGMNFYFIVDSALTGDLIVANDKLMGTIDVTLPLLTLIVAVRAAAAVYSFEYSRKIYSNDRYKVGQSQGEHSSNQIKGILGMIVSAGYFVAAPTVLPVLEQYGSVIGFMTAMLLGVYFVYDLKDSMIQTSLDIKDSLNKRYKAFKAVKGWRKGIAAFVFKNNGPANDNGPAIPIEEVSSSG